MGGGFFFGDEMFGGGHKVLLVLRNGLCERQRGNPASNFLDCRAASLPAMTIA
jgi:hypothetical protein